ncbi:MAG: flagellar export chaperone FliS [Deltaproteobacteria bacterium]|nr:flagellar export chaperone FliS [Deltaproteobacteria bacterium]
MDSYAKDKVSDYTRNDVATANRLQLLIMLYDSAVKFMFVAVKRIDAGDLAGKGEYISKALAIINEFRNTLDFGPAPELARNLDRLYSFIADALIDANIRNDKKRLADALKVTNTLRSAWAELAARQQSGELKDAALEQAARGANADSLVRISV